MAQQQPAAGLVVLGTELSAADVEAFSHIRKPLVFLDTYHEFLPFDFVDMNNQDSVFTVVSHLQARGHRRIGMVTGSLQGEIRNFRLREEAFVASLARCGLPFEQRFVFATDSTFHGAYDDMLAILRRGAELPTALFCSNDIIACGCLKALRRQRRSGCRRTSRWSASTTSRWRRWSIRRSPPSRSPRPRSGGWRSTCS